MFYIRARVSVYIETCSIRATYSSRINYFMQVITEKNKLVYSIKSFLLFFFLFISLSFLMAICYLVLVVCSSPKLMTGFRISRRSSGRRLFSRNGSTSAPGILISAPMMQTTRANSTKKVSLSLTCSS